MRALFIAAHPDDEVIGASSLLAGCAEAHVAHVTDGAPRDRRLWPPGAPPTQARYAALRRREAAQALALVGVPRSRIYDLGFVDQEVCFGLVALTERLAELLASVAPDLLVTHSYEGGHPDHDSVAFSVNAALQRAGPGRWAAQEMTSYHAGEHGWITGSFLPHAEPRPRAVALSENERALKQRMFACFSTQSQVLRLFRIDEELFRPPPTYDFTRPPHPGRLLYETQISPVSGEHWRALALRARGELRVETRPCL